MRFAIRDRPNYSLVESGLWIGGAVDSPPPKTDSVLNLCEVADRFSVASTRWEPINDAAPAPSLDWLERQVRFVAAERAADRVVFVHCRNGVSRSGLVVAAYLMLRKKWTRDQALKVLREKRPEVRPNPAFMDLLEEWQGKLRGDTHAVTFGAGGRIPCSDTL